MSFRDALQLCRPLSGAVSHIAAVTPDLETLLQLCRPLSGAVSWRLRLSLTELLSALQLCRPLSGAVSVPAAARGISGLRFNCAAPFRERLDDAQGLPNKLAGASIVPPPFGSG